MIVVIADDLSGAAELANAALRHGLSAEVQTRFFAETGAEVVCVDTDTRLLAPEEAARRVTEVVQKVMSAQPDWIFKKCDSVLRGPVLAEARAMASAAGLSRILLVPANPSRQRTIRAGKYFVAGLPLNETAFVMDPAHPRLTAEVKALLGENPPDVDVPDISAEADVRQQAANLDSRTLPVGAVDFFNALLEAKVRRRPVPASAPPADKVTLLVCGSATSWLQRFNEARKHGVTTFSLPHDLVAIDATLRTSHSVLLGIGVDDATRGVNSTLLGQQLARSTADIIAGTPVTRLLLEGGATAAAVINQLGWTRLRAEQVADSGIGVLRPVADSAPLVFIKPGSYAWPADIWP